MCLHKTIGRSISSDAEGSLVEWKGMHLIRCNQARKSGGLVGSGEDACCSWRRGRLLFFEGEDACCLWKRKLPRLGARGGGKWPGPAPVCVIHIGSGAHHGRDREVRTLVDLGSCEGSRKVIRCRLKKLEETTLAASAIFPGVKFQDSNRAKQN